MNLLLIFCKGLNVALNPIIVIAAFIEAFLGFLSFLNLNSLKKEIDEINHSSSGSTNLLQKEPGKVTLASTIITERDWNRFDGFCDRYQDKGRLFSGFSQLIQLFPLFGILGTVAGLYIAMNGNQDWTNAQGMFEGVRFALSSTIIGLIMAIIFKTIDVLFTSLYINYIDDGIERFKDKYNEAKGLPLGGDNR